MNFVRFVVSVSSAWTVTVTRDGAQVGETRQLERARISANLPPLPLPPKAQPKPSANVPLDPGKIEEIREGFAALAHRPNDVAAMGSYLFLTLLGEDLWSKIRENLAQGGDRGLELALRFAASENGLDELSRLHWEMMRASDEFLAKGYNGVGGRVYVVITRQLASVSQAMPVPNQIPRALFVIGCSLDDPHIRPGAEFLGLVRQIRSNNRSFHRRVLISASIEATRTAIASFRPDLVYFICHGTPEGELEFEPEPDECIGKSVLDRPSPRKLAAEDVANLFAKPDDAGRIWLPTVVVLSACNTAFVQDGSRTAPLATRLVRDGIPIVVGMGGRVGDRTCRLFTRSFGDALCKGRPLIEAVEIGRRAAFWPGEDPGTVPDWALPVLYVRDQGIGPQFIPLPPGAGGMESLIDMVATTMLGTRNHPSLATRLSDIERAQNALRDCCKGLVKITGHEHAGRSRMLYEIALQALRDGHLPVLLSSYYLSTSAAKDRRELLDMIVRVLGKTANAFRQEISGELQTRLLLNPMKMQDRISEPIKEELTLRNWELTIDVILMALRHDLDRLLQLARSAPDTPISPLGRPIVLLDDVDKLDTDLVHEIFSNGRIGEFGLGRCGAPIPLVFAYRSNANQQAVREDIVASLSPKWGEFIDLRHFDWKTEHVLAIYQQVLLHPHLRDFKNLSDKPWVVRTGATKFEVDAYSGFLETVTDKVPADFNSKRFYDEWVSLATRKGFLVPADDEDVLKDLRKNS